MPRRVLTFVRHRHWVFAWLAAAVFAVLWLWDVHAGPARRWELGTLSDAIGAIAAGGGFGYLLFERGRTIRADRLAAEQVQARMVTAWCSGVSQRLSTKGSLDGKVIVDFELKIHNASDRAIYNAYASIGKAHEGWHVGGATDETFHALGPGETVVVQSSTVRDMGESWPFPPSVLLGFIDAAGRPWWRHADGTLEEAPIVGNDLSLLDDHIFGGAGPE